jgi:FlaA1/EpsC-like NDP-sugar epimerase
VRTDDPNLNDASIWHRLDLLLARLRLHRQPLTLLVDGLVICAAWNVAYLFRLGFERSWQARPSYDPWVLLAVAAAYLTTFIAMRVPRAMWRFSGFGELKRLTLACATAGAVCGIAILALQLVQVPRTVLLLHPLIALLGLCMARLAYRMLYEHARACITGSDNEVRRAIILGAGESARLLLAGLHQEGWTVLGLLDDDPAKRGARILGTPVLGRLDEIAQLGVVREATHVITAMPGATAAQRRRAIELASQTGLPVLTVPSFSELRAGTARVERVRAIEPEDLLGRDPVQLDETGISECLRGKTVLITGAGGSIGSELCRQVARFGPGRLILFELSEFALYTIEQELTETLPEMPLVRLIGDVKDAANLRHVFERYKPQVVFHAAAYKHVPLMEEDNAWAALRNNTLGTYLTAKAAGEAGAERFVLISTDKAVNPTNVMGATKRAAEMALPQLATQGYATRFMAVRFGNVLGSSGSVIPKFKEQIAKGGPVTVTHPEITRYFMTIPEAARLVLQAAAIGESGQVIVLDMGEPVKIVDMARDLIRMSGHLLDDIRITFSGLRPGEKLYEELLAVADRTQPTAHPRLRIALLQTADGERLLEAMRTAGEACGVDATDEAVKRWLREQVPEYRPTAAGFIPLQTDRAAIEIQGRQ